MQNSAAAIGARPAGAVQDLLALTKPNIVWLIVVATFVGFYMASDGPLDWVTLAHTLGATAVLAGGAGALNQWMERGSDAKMRRTERRPMASGRMAPITGLVFAAALVLAGLAWLLYSTNALAAAVGLAVVVAYAGIYTPLKSRTPWATFWGAFPGAAPPLIGWAAVRNELTVEAWILFAILFLWQFPHFYAIAWMYREDYARAGIKMLPVIDPDGKATAKRIVLYGAALVPVSILPSAIGMTGILYAIGASLMSVAYLNSGISTTTERTSKQAKSLLRMSILHLPAIYLLLVLDKV